MVGCVAAGSEGKYTLTNATIPDTQDQSKKGMKPTTYDLVGGELKAHVGHKVEVTGSTAIADPLDKSKQTKTAAETRDSITVKSVKMVSASCT
jgi:hypothetical protein